MKTDQNVRLKFINKTVDGWIDEIHCRKQDIETLMTWYGGFHLGDDYTVYVNDRAVAYDLNGELEPVLIEKAKELDHEFN